MGSGTAVTIECKVCRAEVFDHEDACLRCTAPAGFPNVRIVSAKKERRGLLIRARRGRIAAERAGASNELSRLAAMVKTAPVAFNRRLDQMFRWCSSSDRVFRPWTWEVSQGQRVNPDRFNIGRIAFEHNVNPNYSDNINFAYVDVSGTNLSGYGPIKVFFRTDAVFHRTTFLESNAYYFCQHHHVMDPASMPVGYRSTWASRALLAQAKLGARVRPGMSDANLAHLVLHEDGADGPGDFLEAHIYNPIHISAIDTVFGPAPSEEQAPMWEFIRSTLTSVGATVEVRE